MGEDEQDYYGILCVEREADDRAIKRAYHKQAMRWHPDKNQDNRRESERKFKEIADVRRCPPRGPIDAWPPRLPCISDDE